MHISAPWLFFESLEGFEDKVMWLKVSMMNYRCYIVIHPEQFAP